jgi:hypothetical protein
MFDSLFGKKPPEKGKPIAWEPARRANAPHKKPHAPAPTYAKIFRWRLPEGQTHSPATVEILGSFTNWEKLPLTRDDAHKDWQLTIRDIPAHQTHHYMLLVDGKPAQDKNCDGLAIAHGDQEMKYALATPKGPRVFMLFAQAK